jgi:hypothetical protein
MTPNRPEFPGDPRHQARTQAFRHSSVIRLEYAPNGLDQPGRPRCL